MNIYTQAEELRARWMRHGLAREDLNTDPILQFERWFNEATESGIPEPNAMSLATAETSGQPWLRTVLLKTYDQNGFVFFTNYEGRKARQMEANTSVSLMFPWVALARQVIINGEAQRVPTMESVRYFGTRPRGSQIGAWSSGQSQVIKSRALLEAKFDEMKRKFAQGEVPLPSFWGGYRVVPHRIEFWQGRDNRLHDRFQYTREDYKDSWRIERLAP